MASLSNYAEDKLINYLLLGQAFAVPNLYLALFTSSSGLETNASASQLEIPTSGSGYARVTVPSFTSFTASTSGQSSNSVVFEFPVANSDWGNVSHIAFMDAETGGNVIFWGSVTNPRTVYNGDILRFGVGSIVLACD